MCALAITTQPADKFLGRKRSASANWTRESFDLFFKAVVPPMDLAAVSLALLTASAPHWGTPLYGPAQFDLGGLTNALVFVLVWIVAFSLAGLYKDMSLSSYWDECGRTFVAVSAGMMLLLLVQSTGWPVQLSVGPNLAGYVLALTFVYCGRQLIRVVRRVLFAHHIGENSAVVVGSGPIAQQLAQSLNMDKYSGYRVVGLIDRVAPDPARIAGLPVFAGAEEMVGGLGRPVDELIQADSSLTHEDIAAIVKFATDHHLAYRFVPREVGLLGGTSVPGSLAGLPVLRVRHTPMEGWGRIIKRCFDLVSALFGVVLLIPVFAVIALLIKLLDPGPVFFKQERLSRAGRPFYIYKFRTMMTKYSGKPPLEVFEGLGRPDLVEEFQVDQKVKDDPRVSRLGAFLRKTSLDELPQLWNVVLGGLSLVGPRPIVREELAKFGDAASLILALKPGITGAWQISGRNDLTYEDRVRLNIEYVERWNLVLDIRILLKTVLVLFRGRGAY